MIYVSLSICALQDTLLVILVMYYLRKHTPCFRRYTTGIYNRSVTYSTATQLQRNTANTDIPDRWHGCNYYVSF